MREINPPQPLTAAAIFVAAGHHTDEILDPAYRAAIYAAVEDLPRAQRLARTGQHVARTI